MWQRPIALALISVAAATGVSACSSSSAEAPAATASAAVAAAGATVIDVRTPEEFADGHLEGAQNINLQSPSFNSEIEALPKDADYVVYCRSGNRSADATAQMKAMGFTNVTDAGSVSEASAATGLPVVQ